MKSTTKSCASRMKSSSFWEDSGPACLTPDMTRLVLYMYVCICICMHTPDEELKLLRRLRAGMFDPGYDPVGFIYVCMYMYMYAYTRWRAQASEKTPGRHVRPRIWPGRFLVCIYICINIYVYLAAPVGFLYVCMYNIIWYIFFFAHVL